MKKSEKKKLIRECHELNKELIKKYNLAEMVEEVKYSHQADFLSRAIESMLCSKSIDLIRSGAEY